MEVLTLHFDIIKEGGSRLVGQCEISHPVPPNPAPVEITLTGLDPYSPVDGMGEFIAQSQNMMFESTSKSDYESLDSRISSMFCSMPFTVSTEV
ncbi:hypothetical protein DXG03_001951 [Asterophora parasitica]|uniref:Uncharacterized protein n=1 Tax=Asterophora parasitica TaxID=117018 RepID=A0A9P7KFH6_9AGAR|nr:hypothetical protein DXG03_001951 [Asterophora parasitica]